MKINIPDAIRSEVEDFGQRLAKLIGAAYRKLGIEGRFGFVLLLFSYRPGFLTYVSDSRRSDIIKALRETADVLEAEQDEAPMRDTARKH